MRVLHTSDWHLGQELHRYDRQYEHQQFLKWLIGVIIENDVDVLLVAGDVFDTSNPPASAQRLFFNFVMELSDAVKGLKVIVTAGNHDSPSRIEAPSEMLNAFSVNVVGRISSTPDGLQSARHFLIPLSSKGSDTPEALCVALPYLRTADVLWPAEVIAYPEGVMRAYRQALQSARAEFGSSLPLIAMGHMHASGGQTSDESERKLVIGGEAAVPLLSLANEFAYVALGHLHLAQKVGGCEHIRYCGSPLPLSFSEINYPHQVVLFEIQGSAFPVQIQTLRVPRFVEMLRCPSEPSDLDTALAALKRLKLDPNAPLEQHPFLEIPVQLNGPTPDMRSRVDQVLKDLPVRLGRILVSEQDQPENFDRSSLSGLDSLRNIDPLAVFENIHASKWKSAPSPELKALFEEVFRQVSEGADE
jgi:exonuclease SbcD